MLLNPFFGKFGGQFVPELLIPALDQLEKAFVETKDDPSFQAELNGLLTTYAGRPTPITLCRNLTKGTKAKLDRGARLVELLKQPQYQPMPAQEQVASIWAATRGHMDDVPVDQVRRFETEMLTFLRDTRKDVLDAIKDKKVIDEAVESALTEAVAAFKQGWQA